jgi:hypothetical protein
MNKTRKFVKNNVFVTVVNFPPGILAQIFELFGKIPKNLFCKKNFFSLKYLNLNNVGFCAQLDK